MIMKILRFWPSAIVVAVILYATLASNPTGDVELMLFPYADKLIHAIMFGGLTGALAFDFRRSGSALTRRLMLAIAAGVAAFGAIDECLQALLTEVRAGDEYDWLADMAGIFVAYFTAPPAVNRLLEKK